MSHRLHAPDRSRTICLNLLIASAMSVAGGFDPYAHLAAPTTQGESCPLCGGFAGTDPNPELLRVCKLCGGPRIPLPPGSALSPPARVALADVDAARKRRGLWSAVAGLSWLGVAAGVVIGGAAAIWSLPIGAALFALSALPSFGLGQLARSRRTLAAQVVTTKLDAAWSATATELLASGQARDAVSLAELTGAPLDRAQQWLLSAEIDAEIGGRSTGLRVDTAGLPRSSLTPDPRFAALEAAAAAEAEAEFEAGSSTREHARR